MQTRTPMGMNRTGTTVSPLGARAMQQIAEQAAETMSDDSLATLRGIAFDEADGVGSVPLPAGVKGVAKSAAAALKGKAPEYLIDKLGERLAFERSGARLYEALITKCEHDPECAAAVIAELHHIHDEELAHFGLLKRAMESLGADPTAQTPCADVSAVMSSGIVQVVTDPRTTLAQSLEAILVAELADNASWEMLLQLVRDAGHDDLVAGFEQALQQEQAHLAKIKPLLQQSAATQMRARKRK